ncbi:VWA domain-containing protein [Halioglobus maricola]|uniref:VWA domain-containing protein n=1 Tax=Halioglobus maricola TaxID=2601894 RepID=A0A5P9NH96_9GAMM|nr:vWA domain-containing protein [Halioglobus maricola]QFU74584.1 VWA domain-containing protein [Halioglobus maricola]
MYPSIRKFAARATSATLAGIVAFSLSLVASHEGHAVLRNTEDPIDNPDLEQACGLNVLMILDESGSIGDNDDNVRTAFKAFTAAIKNTSSSMAVAEFSKVARLPKIGVFNRGDYITVTDDTKVFLDNYVDNDYDPGGNTNWEDGLRMGRLGSAFAPRPSFDVPHLTVFITDGDPTQVIRNDRVTDDEYNNKVPLSDNETTGSDKNPAADRAVANANNLKSQDSHILVVAVGNGVSSNASLARIQKISGPDVHPDGDPFDITTDDVYREPNFDELEDALREAAFQLCSPSVTVEKIVDLTPDPDSLDDAIPGPLWQITGEVAAPGSGEFAWILPVKEDPALTDAKTTLTDASGFATFQWRPADEVDSSGFVATEVVQSGFTNDESKTICTFRTPDSPDADLPLDDSGEGTFTITVPEQSIVTCKFFNLADPAPGITLEKLTDGVDADTRTGPVVPRGDVVNWSYQVANTGNTILSGISIEDLVTEPVVFDGQVQPVDCPKTTLIQGESMTCTASGISGMTPEGDSFTGQFRNDATVRATDSYGTPVSATDPSHYFEVEPGISVEKSTNGEDADQQPGPLVRVGRTINWLYEVRNTGSEPLANIAISDDQGVTLNYQGGDLDGDNLLDVTEVWLYSGLGMAVAGQYANRAIVSGEGSSETVTDEDPSHYFGLDMQIDIEKSTNGEDADVAPGPTLERGAPVNWTYAVRNVGNFAIDNWTVVDDQLGAINCPSVVLVPGGPAAICSAVGTASAGQYRNVAVATAPNPAGGAPATDSDPSHYFGALPALTLEKATNGQDADTPTGPFIEVGGPVNWTYVATNAGNVALRLLAVVDSKLPLGSVDCPDDILDPAESVVCTASGISAPGQYSNLGLALAVPVVDDPNDPRNRVGDFDLSHYFGASPGIGIEKFTNGIDADTPETAARIPIGDVVEWGYVVFNTGNEPLRDVVVTDNQGEIPVYVEGDTNNNNQLDLDERWLFEAQGTAGASLYSNIGTARGTDSLGAVVTETDPSHYFGYENAITVEKSTNGEDADTAPGPNLAINAAVTWEYVVTNTGAAATPLVQVRLVDDQLGVIAGPDSGDDNNNDVLDPNEVWIYTAVGVAQQGQYANVATITGIGPAPENEELEDTDPSHYFGGDSSPALVLEKYTDGVDADVAPGPLLEVGNSVLFVYVAENTGDVPLEQVEVTDDQGVTVLCAGGNPIPEIPVGGTGYCVGAGTVTGGQYANIGTAEGTGLLGTDVIATDPSHHFGYASLGGREDPEIDIEKATNGADADNPPGPLLLQGSAVDFTYVVTNTGNVPLATIELTDDQGVVVDCPSGNPIPLMLPGESETCTGDALVTRGNYRNVGTASGVGTGVLPPVVEDTDPSHHKGLNRNELFGVPVMPLFYLIMSALALTALVGHVRRK